MLQKSVRISADSLENLYLFVGEEAYKKRNYKEKLRSAAGTGMSINYSHFEGKDIDMAELYDSVVTLPFFAAKRIVIVENSGLFESGKKKDADRPEDGKKGVKLIDKLFTDLPETTCLAFFETNAAKNKKIYKEVLNRGIVCECDPDTPEQVAAWLAKGFSQAGKKIKKSTAMLLIDRAGTDYDRLHSEYEKIVAYAGDSEVITDEDVLAVTSEDTEGKIFDMLGAMSLGNKKEVCERYYELLENKEPPLKILAMIRSQVRTLLQVKEFMSEGLSEYETAEKMGIQRFRVQRSRRYVMNVGKKDLEGMLDEISDTDKRIKTGDITDQLGVETLLLSLSGRGSAAHHG